MLSDFFIKRPVFATVVAIIMTMVGGIVIPFLPVAQYPQVAPPQVSVESTYIGANSEQVESSVTQLLEREINGADNLKYIQSQSANDGKSKIICTFDLERDVDLAAVDVQTRVAAVQGKLPEDVKKTGTSIKKVSTSIVMVLGVYAEDGKYSPEFISNYVDLYLKDAFKRLPSVGDVSIVGERKYAMRIWLDPKKLAQYKLTPLDVSKTIQKQNKQVGAGDLGRAPAPSGQMFQINLRAMGRLVQPEEFANMIIKRSDDGTLIKVKDVGRVELGAESYDTNGAYNGKDAVVVVVYLRPGGNAIQVSDGVTKELERLRRHFPPGLKVDVALNTTDAVKASIEEVIHTLFEAIVLVIIVIFFFLQDWRSVLIPSIAIPVSLIGTFVFLKVMGFSINTLTMFGITLATGLVVDDAIVVVENVKRLIDEEGMSPMSASFAAMREISGAVVATTLVLFAVFIPVAFFPGTTGQLYKQFAITISVSVGLSMVNALTLSPPLCALWLKREDPNKQFVLFKKINDLINYTTRLYKKLLVKCLRLSTLIIVLFFVCLGATYWLSKVLPTAFVPDEDQGYFYTMIRAPEGTSLEYTTDIIDKAAKVISKQPEVKSVTGLAGFGFQGNGPNLGIMFTSLHHWEERDDPSKTVHAVIGRIRKPLAGITGASVVPFLPPSIEGLGSFGGFVYELQDLMGTDIQDLNNMAAKIIRQGNASPELQGLFTSFSAQTPQLKLSVNRDEAERLNVDIGDLLTTLQMLSGSAYINDFDFLNKTYRVYVQADKEYRVQPADIFEYYVRSRDGKMVSMKNLLKQDSALTAQVISHYNLFRSAEINGNPSPGKSSGEALTAMNNLSEELLPSGMSHEWSGVSLEELSAGSSAIFIFILGLVFVYLVLSAQYESYVDPIIIMLSVPLAVLGAFLFQWMRGLQNDVFCQVGLVMLIGMASKNAILIVEFANHLRQTAGLTVVHAVIKASTLRLRPILMTAFAFIIGILPLVFATGAGAASRNSLGTAVCGGMTVATLMSLLVVPVIYLIINNMKTFVGGLFKKDESAGTN